MPFGTVAWREALVMVMATAAATLMGPAEVDALGVLVDPLPSAPLAAAVASA
jgi:hypothetical protein